MKYVVTDRAPHLGPTDRIVELTPSQALYEKLRGHIVVAGSTPAKSADAETRLARRGKRK